MQSVLRAVVVALCLCPAGAFAQDAAPATIHVAAGYDVESTPLIYAQKAGLFRDAGLDVVIDKVNGGGVAIAAAVAGGSLQVGKASSFSLIAAYAHGIPFVLLAPAATYSRDAPDLPLIVAAGSALRTARDLTGHTIGVVSLSTTMLLATRVWIDQNGGDSTAVHFVEISPTAAAAAIDQGRIDGDVLAEPALSAAMHTGRYRVLSYPYGAIAAHFELADWFANAAWVAAHHDAAQKFAEVMQRANAYVASHESELTPLIAAYVGIDPAVLAQMKNPERGTFYRPADLQPVIDDAAKYKFIPSSFPAAALISDAALKPPK